MSIYKNIRSGIQQFVYKVIDPGVRVAVRLGITPNVVTTLGMLGNGAGAAILVYAAMKQPGDYSLIGWAGIVIIISSSGAESSVTGSVEFTIQRSPWI